jgi:hypothetical protein
MLIKKLHGKQDAKFTLISSLHYLTQDKIKTLRIFADDKFEKAIQMGSSEIDDLKINLTKA